MVNASDDDKQKFASSILDDTNKLAFSSMTRQMMRILFAVRFFICQQSTTSEPKGMNASFANLKY